MITAYDRDELRRKFQTASPFPSLVIDDFLEPKAALEVAQSYPTFDDARSQGRTFNAVNEQRKVQITDAARFPEAVRRFSEAIASPSFLADLSYITGIPRLLADPKLMGGGMHVTGPGGRLDVHVDFNYLEEQKLHRRLNLLLYLNPEWHDDWGGDIELWDREVTRAEVRLKPILNRCVMFQTNEISFHGVRPVTTPQGVTRQSFAAYYYTREAPPRWQGQVHSTIFRARPEERFRKYVLMPAEHLKGQVKGGVRRIKKEIKRIVLGAHLA